MKVPSKTPQQMVEFWEAELAKIDEEEALSGITLWSRNFIQAKIQIWKEVRDAKESQRKSQALQGNGKSWGR